MIKANEIISHYGIKDWYGDFYRPIIHVGSIEDMGTKENCLFWVSYNNLWQLTNVTSGVVICTKFSGPFNDNVTYLFVERPRDVFAKVIEDFFYVEEIKVVSNNAIIADNVLVGSSFSVGPFVVIESGCIIGDEVEIGAGTIIKKNTIIGNNVIIGANCTIGGVGFGYVNDQSGYKKQIRHIGNVVIEDYVEIGNNTCIDRAVIGSTVLQKNVKVDNLVHIAHGVNIGQNSLVIASAQIAGSVKIGKNCWIAPNCSIIQKIIIGDNVIVGIGSVVLKNIPDGGVVMGNPARAISRTE